MPPSPQDLNVATPSRLLPVHVESIDPQVLDLDLWIRYADRPRPALYRKAGLEYKAEDLTRLRAAGVEFLYIPATQHAQYRQLLVRKLDATFKAGGQAPQERRKIIRKTCTRMIEEVLVLPGVTEPLHAVAEVSNLAVHWINSDPQGFTYLLDMSAHDFYTATHMVNVGMGCAMLCKKLRPDDPQLLAITQGGLLHDLGKRSIPIEILNKEGKLTPEEFEIIKKHPTLGLEELSKQSGLPPVVLEMAADHHERLDGRGYPKGKSGKDIGFAARICAVVDVFDALMAARPYRQPIHPRDALECMLKGADTHFDAQVLGAWRELVVDLLTRDPNRASGTTMGQLRPTLTQVSGSDNAAAAARTITGHARVIDQGNICISSHPVTVSKLGPEGAEIRCVTPLANGQTIALVFNETTALGAARRGTVESVKPDGAAWLIGITFSQKAKEPGGEKEKKKAA